MSKASILVVEDEQIVALDIQSQLERLGYDVVATVSSGRAAISTAEATRPDLALMDIKLKGDMDGIQAAQHIRSRFGIPVIYLTAYADQGTLDRAKVTESFGYILKPFEEGELHATIEMALYKHRADAALRAHALELKRKNRQLELISQIVTASVDGQNTESILQMACRELVDVLDTPHATAVLLNKDGTTARVVTEFHLDGKLRALNATVNVAGTPLLQHLLRYREPLVIASFDDPRLAPFRGLIRESGPRPLLILPLVVEGDVIGALGLVGTASRSFSPNDVDLAWSVTGQLAGALSRARLAEERKRLSAALEQTTESVIMTDMTGTIVYVNPAFERITGYNRAEIVGQHSRSLGGDRQDAAVREKMRTAIATGGSWQGRLVNEKKDGSLYTVEATITPVRDGGGDIVNHISVQRDVTRELKLEEQYRQALKMEAVGRLAAGIAHDFNNLLTVINAYADFLQAQLPPDPEIQELAEGIVGAGERAADLTRQLLAFSRKQIVDPQVLDLSTVLIETCKMLKRTIGEHIELHTDFAPHLWLVEMDPVQIERAIVNLAVNARDAMPDGGRLTLSTRNVTLGEEDLSFDPELKKGEYVMLSIADTGIGMSAEVQRHLFEPFFTTKEMGRGTGLGLATVYGIVKQSGGAIRDLPPSRRGDIRACSCARGHAGGRPFRRRDHSTGRRRCPSTQSDVQGAGEPGVHPAACPGWTRSAAGGSRAHRPDPPATDRRDHARWERPDPGRPADQDATRAQGSLYVRLYCRRHRSPRRARARRCLSAQALQGLGLVEQGTVRAQRPRVIDKS
jgi:PAS domain S-box-containing protein